MHRAAESLVEAGGAGEDLGHRTVEQEADSEFLGRALEAFLRDGDGGSVPEFVHDLLKLGIRKNLDGAESLGEDFAVGAVRSEDEVVGVERVGHSDGGRLLSR